MKRLLTAVLLSGVCAASALAQNASKPSPAQPAGKADQPKHDDKARMEAMEKAGQPGANHKILAALEGEWNADVKEFGPAGPGDPSQGRMRSKLVFDGRFLHMEYEGQMHGKPFRGAGTLGYSNADKRFESTWAENLSTAQSFMTGQADAAGKVLTLTGEFTDPVSGAKATQKQVLTIADKDHYKMEFFFTGKDGKETKIMEIGFSRGKGGSESKDSKEGHEEHGKEKDKNK